MVDDVFTENVLCSKSPPMLAAALEDYVHGVLDLRIKLLVYFNCYATAFLHLHKEETNFERACNVVSTLFERYSPMSWFKSFSKFNSSQITSASQAIATLLAK